MRRAVIVGLICAACLAGANTAFAQAWPARPIRIIVPFPAGGATDTAARLIQPGLQHALGVPVIVDNRPGASGIIGTAAVAKAPADGYTLLMTLDTHTVNAAVASKLPYDTEDDFTAITRIGTMPFVLVANAELPIHSLTDFVSVAKAHPGALNYGTPAPAVTLAMELFKSLAGIDVQRVVYRGGAPAVQSVISNETQVTFLPPVSAMPSIQSGKLRPLAVAGARRLPALSDLETVGEAGYPTFEAGSWAGLLAPAHLPPAIVARLYADIVSVVEPVETRRRFIDLGMDINPMPPAEFGRFLSAQVAKWTKVAKDNHIVAED